MVTKNKAFIFIIFITAIAFIVPSFYSLNAINLSTDQVAGAISLIITPENPEPNQIVKIAAESYTFNIDSANVSWYLNGKLQQKGIGSKTFSFKAGETGSLYIIKIEVLNNGIPITKEISLQTTDIDIIWQADTSKPVFYKGKSPFTYQSDLKIIAIPHLIQNGKEISPKNLIYKWSQNGKVFGDLSGYGKNSISIEWNILPKEIPIRVEVSSQDSKIMTSKMFSITPKTPETWFYENDPLYGILYNKIIRDSLTLTKKEITLINDPFGFTKGYNQNWIINDKEVKSPDNKSISLRNQNDTDGFAKVEIEVKNEERFMQLTSNNILIYFKKLEQN